jgi:hypothetical protein
MANDLISRSGLSENLAALTMTITGLRAGKGVLREFMTEYRESVLRIVDEVPAVDAVEVVRCKDCKHFLSDLGVTYCDYHTAHACDDDGYCDGACGVYEDDFCSYGEKRSVEHD